MINKPPPEMANITSPDDMWLATAPLLRPELNIDVRKHGKRFIAVIEDPTRAKFFQVGYNEFQFISLLDGQTTVQEIMGSLISDRGGDHFSMESAKAICGWLANNNLLLNSGGGTSDRLSKAARAKQKQQLMGILNPISFRINLLNPNKSLQKLTPYLKWLFTAWMLVVWLALGIIATHVVVTDYPRFADAAFGILGPGRWIWLLIVWVVLKIIHETAHGIACQKYGGDVRQAGVLILLLAPLAFVDVTSSWRFNSRSKRIVVAFAGMYVELLVAFLAVIVWSTTQSELISDIAYNIVIMAGVSTVLFNANPLIRFDGYYILADTLGVVNLYTKGQNWFGDRARHLIFGFAKDPNVCPRNELPVVAIYGVASFCWRVFLSASLLLVASSLLQGAGLVLALVGGVFWVLFPLFQNIKKIRMAATAEKVDRLRCGVVCGTTLLTVLACFVWIKAPAVTRAPAIVQFKDEQILRAATDGFVREILVSDGQSVRQNQPLLRLANPELELELLALKQSAEQTRIQARVYRQRGELSKNQAELSNLDSMQQQIAEKQSQVDSLTVSAPTDGRIFQRGLENLQGSFLSQGDVVMKLAKPGSKEVLISIDQQQIQSVKRSQQRMVRASFSGLPLIDAKFTSIQPRATDTPIDPSLTADAGGPLAVRAATASESQGVDDKGFRLLVPRFTAKLSLPNESAGQLAAGQRGTAFIYGRDISLGGQFWVSCRNWVRNTLAAATGASY